MARMTVGVGRGPGWPRGVEIDVNRRQSHGTIDGRHELLQCCRAVGHAIRHHA